MSTRETSLGENPSSSGLERAIAELHRVQALPPYDGEEDYYNEYDEYVYPDDDDCGPADAANWGWMYPDRIELSLGRPCHGELGAIPEGAVGLIEFMTFEDPHGLNWDAAKAFADWLMIGADFPWAAGRPTHYEPGVGWYWSESDLRDKPTNAIGAFLILTRKFFETAGHINGWHKLVQLGCTPRAAFMFAQYFFCGFADGEKLGQHLESGGHSPFDVRFRITREQYLNYMRGNPVGPSRHFIPQGDYFGEATKVPYPDRPPDGFDSILKPLTSVGRWEAIVIDPALTVEKLAEFIKQQEVLCENEQP